MFNPNEQQVGIYVLKTELDEIENALISHQNSTLPKLDAENEHLHRKNMDALDAVRNLYNEIEKLKLDNITLTARRAQLKTETDQMQNAIQHATKITDKMNQMLEEENKKEDDAIDNYVASMSVKAETYRKTFAFYDEKGVTSQTENLSKINCELQKEVEKRQSVVDNLKEQIESLKPILPENITDIVAKKKLEEKLKEVKKTLDELVSKR